MALGESTQASKPGPLDRSTYSDWEDGRRSRACLQRAFTVITRRMTTSLSWVFLITLVVATITPGPSMLLALHHGVRFGTRRALGTALGNVCGTALQCGVSLAGLTVILTRLEWLASALRLMGAAYLFYLGLTALFAKTASTLSAPTAAKHGVFVQAFLVTLGNPKAIFFFSALFPQFMGTHTLALPQACAMLLATLTVTFACMMLYASAGEHLQHALSNQRVQLWFNRTVGTTFIGLGLGLALDRR